LEGAGWCWEVGVAEERKRSTSLAFDIVERIIAIGVIVKTRHALEWGCPHSCRHAGQSSSGAERILQFPARFSADRH